MIDRLRLRHERLEQELSTEQARLNPDDGRIARLKKLKLAVKDRIQLMLSARGEALPMPA